MEFILYIHLHILTQYINCSELIHKTNENVIINLSLI